MPIYEFRCSDCSQDFEELVRSMAAVDRVKCPNCGSVHVQKRMSSFVSKVSGGASSFASSSSSCATGST